MAVVAAFTLFTGSEIARWFGICVAGLYAFDLLMFVQASSWRSNQFALRILVVSALAAYGGSRLRTQ